MSSRPLPDALAKATTTAYGVTRLASDGEATAGEAVQASDPRLSDGRPPEGAAGGVLGGSYPDPSFAVDMATQAELNAHTVLVDAVPGAPHHTLGAGPNQAAPGDHTHAGTTPAAHAASHATGGADPVSPASIGAATQASLDAEATARATADSLRPTGVTGLAGRVAWYSAASVLDAYASSIFRDPATGFIGIGTETPSIPLHIVLAALSAVTSGSSLLLTTDVAAVLSGTANVHSMAATYSPPTDPGGTARIFTGLRSAAVANTGAFNPSLTMRAMNAVAQHSGTGVLGGIATGQHGQVLNLSTGTIAAANGLTSQIQQNAAGTITLAAGMRALRPVGASGAVFTTLYGLYVEQQRPASGSVGSSNGIYQEGTLDQNTYKGPSQFDGKATFAAQPAGIEKVIGWYDEVTPGAASLGPTYPVTSDVTLVRSEGWAEVVATGAAAQFDIQYKRGGGAWTSIFSTLPQFAVGANQRTAGTISTTTLNAGDFVRRRWLGTPATIADVSLYLVGVTR